MSFLLLGHRQLDRLRRPSARSVEPAVAPAVSPRSSAIADGVAFLVGAGLGWQLFSDGASGVLDDRRCWPRLGLYLIVVAAGIAAARRACRAGVVPCRRR